MSYGRMSPFFADAGEAQAYLDNCRAAKNYAAENYQDRVNANIAYIFREKMKTRDRAIWGQAGKADGKLSFFAGYDFVIEINWQAWKGLSDMQKIALVDHELAHCARDENDKGERKWVLLGHDIEEFTGVVQRWGLWRNDLKVFAGAVTHAQQLGMFEGSKD